MLVPARPGAVDLKRVWLLPRRSNVAEENEISVAGYALFSYVRVSH